MSQFTTSLPHLASEVFDGEVVIADFVSGSYYSLTGVAALIWQSLRDGHTQSDIGQWLGQHFNQEASADVEHFVRQLVETGLAAPKEAPSPVVQPLPSISVAKYTAPTIDRHDDLADLLLLDPVHDVAQAGWPHLPDNETK